MAKEKEKDILSSLAEMNLLSKKDEYIKTTIPPLDMYVAGRNSITNDIGFIRGKFVSLCGPNGIGKSTFMMELAKRFCKQNLKVVYCDYEGGLNEKSLDDFGLAEYAAYDRENPKKAIQQFIDGEKPFLVLNPVTYNKTAVIWQQMLEKLNMNIDVGIFDSLKTIQSTYSTENVDSLEQLPMGINARSQEAFLPFMKTLFSTHKVLGLFVHQFRTKMSMHGGYQGEPDSNAFLYNMDERMVMKSKRGAEIEIKVINDSQQQIDKKIGNWVDITLTKSRVGNAFSVLSLPIIFGAGISIIYKYTAILIDNGIFVPGPNCNSKTDLTPLKTALSEVGDASEVPEVVSQGMDGVYKAIRDNFALIEKFIFEKEMLFVERPA